MGWMQLDRDGRVIDGAGMRENSIPGRKGDMKHCTAHYHACDCREQMFAEMAADNKSLKRQLEYANGKLSEAMLTMEELREIVCKPNAPDQARLQATAEAGCSATTIARTDAQDDGKWRRCELEAGHTGDHETTYCSRPFQWPNDQAQFTRGTSVNLERFVGAPQRQETDDEKTDEIRCRQLYIRSTHSGW